MSIYPETLEAADRIKNANKAALDRRTIISPSENDLELMLLANFDLDEVVKLAEDALASRVETEAPTGLYDEMP